MTSILLLIRASIDNQSKCNYIRKKKLFLNFLLELWNLDQILKKKFEKKITLIADAFLKLKTVKDVVR